MNPFNEPWNRKPWSERLSLFFFMFVFWLVLAWPVTAEGALSLPDVLLGVLIALLVAWLMRAMFRRNFARLFKPRCWFWGLVYLFVFAWYVLRGGMDVVYRVLHPGMPIRPGIVRAQSILETDTARIALANSITLTPGTLTIEVTDDGVFYVHWLNVLSEDGAQAAEHILRRFEWFLKRIFE